MIISTAWIVPVLALTVQKNAGSSLPHGDDVFLYNLNEKKGASVIRCILFPYWKPYIGWY
ncbi:hypothetical protein KH172YL63_25000 [Bacillus sp. KH172YL63]|nr:hypothetical protein KH172YL63_25000 [Bacillus sp. KH172YL63]